MAAGLLHSAAIPKSMIAGGNHTLIPKSPALRLFFWGGGTTEPPKKEMRGPRGWYGFGPLVPET